MKFLYTVKLRVVLSRTATVWLSWISCLSKRWSTLVLRLVSTLVRFESFNISRSCVCCSSWLFIKISMLDLSWFIVAEFPPSPEPNNQLNTVPKTLRFSLWSGEPWGFLVVGGLWLIWPVASRNSFLTVFNLWVIILASRKHSSRMVLYAEVLYRSSALYGGYLVDSGLKNTGYCVLFRSGLSLVWWLGALFCCKWLFGLVNSRSEIWPYCAGGSLAYSFGTSVGIVLASSHAGI